MNGGEVSQLEIGILGTMNELFISQLAEKTKIGQRGRIEAGKIAGGLAYGYDVGPAIQKGKTIERGHRAINMEQALVVRRIFQEYASGLSPRKIAQRLNNDHVPGPGKRAWNDTTIRGQVKRGNRNTEQL